MVNKEIKNKKKSICHNIMELNKENRISVYSFLRNKINESLIINNADGIRIDLNNLEEPVINELYNIINYKLNIERKK